MQFLYALIGVCLLSACGGQKQSEKHLQTTQIKSENAGEPNISYEQACAGLAGQWEPISRFDLSADVTAHSGTYICNLPTSDEKTNCSSWGSCEGRCIKSDTIEKGGYCSDRWLAEQSIPVLPKPHRTRGNPGEPQPVPDVLYSAKIDRIKNYVLHRYMWEQNKPYAYTYSIYFNGGIVSLINPAPATVKIENDKIISAQYIGPDNQDYKSGENYAWTGEDPLSFFWTSLASTISRQQVNDTLKVVYNPELGFPSYFERSHANVSDSWFRVEFKNFTQIEK